MLTIVSMEDQRKRATGVLRPDGTFRLAGAPIGKSQVVIDTSSVKLGSASDYMELPKKYANLRSTDLIVDLEPGENEGVELRLSSKR